MDATDPDENPAQRSDFWKYRTRDPVAACRETLSMARHPDTALLYACLQADDLDGALQAGLMAFPAAAGDIATPQQAARILAAQTQVRRAWDARERYRARAVRLARRAAERYARRSPPPAPDGTVALPSAAAAILARAKARAAGQAD